MTSLQMQAKLAQGSSRVGRERSSLLSRRVVVGVVGVLAAVLASVSLAWACVPQGYLSLTPASGPAGSTVTAKASGFPAGSTVEIRWMSKTGQVLSTGTGPSFSTPIKILAAAPGVYYVSAATTGEHRDHSATVAAFRIAAPGTPAPGGTTPTGGRTITGTMGDDRLVGTPFNDVINCGAGNDRVLGNGGDDVINCGSGHDRVDGGDGKDRILGGSGIDVLKGGRHNDRISAGSGNDRLWGGSGNDRLLGGRGNDALRGESGRDRLYGQSGRDVLFRSGTDRLFGGSGRDRIAGKRAPSNDDHGQNHGGHSH